MAESIKVEKDHENGDAEEKKERGGIIIKNILFNLVSHKVEETPHDDAKKEEEVEEKKQEEKWVFENLISNLVSPKAGGVSKLYDHEIFDIEDDNQVVEEETVKMDEGGEEEGGGGGSFIDNIVSHLPKSLPEDAAPTTDEASILIHSIVHD